MALDDAVARGEDVVDDDVTAHGHRRVDARLLDHAHPFDPRWFEQVAAVLK
jgi:hypothetical protein